MPVMAFFIAVHTTALRCIVSRFAHVWHLGAWPAWPPWLGPP